jgi:hypothetical protein
MTEKIDHENWCPIHEEMIARNQLECFECRTNKRALKQANKVAKLMGF